MKVLSIKQPWATLISKGIKDIENRVWKTGFRGKFLIHASKTWDSNKPSSLFTKEQIKTIPVDLILAIQNKTLPVSAILGQCDLIQCVNNSNSIWAVKGQNHLVLRNIIEFPTPFLGVNGMLGFWNYELERNNK